MTDMKTDALNSSDAQEFEEIQIPVPWGHIAGKWWGSKDVQPIICLHGWQDNAGTFDSLAPLLSSRMALLALDLSGHGHSSHVPTGVFYYLWWEGVLNLRRVVLHYKWDKVSSPSDQWQKRVSEFFTGKWWGSRNIQPIIVLHGRQDNAGSFDALMPSLSDSKSFLCLDLPGHGFSSHLPKGQYYYVHWDGIQIIRRVVKYFKWTKVKILGHSLGGAIAFLYAGTYPDEVDTLICLDIASPNVREINKMPTAAGENIDRFLKYENLTLDNVPCYEYEEMIDIVEGAYYGSITRKSAEILMRRGMQPAPIPGRHYFSRDPRLKTAILGMLSIDLIFSFAAQIKCNYLNVRAVPGMKFENPDHYQKVLDIIREKAKRFEYFEVEGTHHVHLNEPEKVAPIVKAFLQA